MSKTTAQVETERLPPIVLLIFGVLSGIAITALIFCFLSFKLKLCNRRPLGERKSSTQSEKIETAAKKLNRGRSNSVPVSDKWRNGYGSRKGSEDVTGLADKCRNVSQSTADPASNGVIIQVKASPIQRN